MATTTHGEDIARAFVQLKEAIKADRNAEAAALALDLAELIVVNFDRVADALDIVATALSRGNVRG